MAERISDINVSALRATAPRRGRLVDFNALLMALNLVIGVATALRAPYLAGNYYVNQESIGLGLLLCLQTQCALWIERRRRDPFVILLAFELIVYYSLRIFTLTVFSFSEVFSRYPYDATDTNFALEFILIANMFLYAGLFMVGTKGQQRIDATNWRPTSPAMVVGLLVVAILFAYFSGSYWTEDNIPRGISFLVLFLTPSIVSLMSISYYMLFRYSLGRRFALAIALLIIIDMLAHTLVGSRSALVIFVQSTILVTLAIRGRIRLRRKYVGAGVALLPVMMVLLVGSFAISTYNRASREFGASIDVSQALRTASESTSNLSSGPDFDILLPPIFSRVGFFDYSAELIAHRRQYQQLMNLPTYGRSIVDNLLTPGFDLYDQPKIAQSMQFIYQDWGVPSKLYLQENYQSDQIGVYGEFYALFGFGSLPLLFLVMLLLKRLYVRMRAPNPFGLAMRKIIVLSAFVGFIRSFGMDWQIVEILPLIAATFLYGGFFASRPVPPGRCGISSGGPAISAGG